LPKLFFGGAAPARTGGAIFTAAGGAAATPFAGAAVRIAFTCCVESGRPPLAFNASCRAANETCGGGGFSFATTGRSTNFAGGAFADPAFAANRLRCCGTTPAPTAVPIGAFSITRASTFPRFLPTGWPVEKAFCEVAVTYVRFTYVTFVTVLFTV
jgi:hypothetical protein